MSERTYAYPGEDEFDMEFSTTEGGDDEMSETALEELSNNQGEDE